MPAPIVSQYDAIVVGTGFGGTIAAIALSAASKKVLLIERGTFWITPETLGNPPPPDPQRPALRDWAKAKGHPVQFWARPDNGRGIVNLLAALRTDLNKRGLYQYSMFDEAHILTASGVGGGSLIYSNVNLQPMQEVLDRIGLGGLDFKKARSFMERYRGKFNRVVTKIPLPGRDVSDLPAAEEYLYLDRSRALKRAAAEASQTLGVAMPWAPLDLSVVDYDPDPASASSKTRTFCERQGRCILGCLPAARHTLNKTLYNRLLWDDGLGITLSSLSEVREIRRTSVGYKVVYRDHRNDQEHEATAPMVFLGAGTLGTTEILMRSANNGGLRLSPVLGCNFSTNGDFGAFAVGTRNAVYSTRGPINTSDVRFKLDGFHITIEDCGIPAMVAGVAKAGLDHIANNTFQIWKALWSLNPLANLGQLVAGLSVDDPRANQTEAEMVADIFFFNAMGQDEANGRFSFTNDKLDLRWDKPISKQPVFVAVEKALKTLSDKMGGRYVALPTWEQLLGPRKLIVTHPLGGCPIGANIGTGAVDAFGQVFDGSVASRASTAVLPGLYVVDGAAIPGALAANPTLTIAAQAIKTVEHAVAHPIPNL